MRIPYLMKTTINVYGNTDFQFAYMINMKLKHQFPKKINNRTNSTCSFVINQIYFPTVARATLLRSLHDMETNLPV